MLSRKHTWSTLDTDCSPSASRRFIAFSAEENRINPFEELRHPVVLVGKAPIEFPVRSFEKAAQTHGKVKNNVSHTRFVKLCANIEVL